MWIFIEIRVIFLVYLIKEILLVFIHLFVAQGLNLFNLLFGIVRRLTIRTCLLVTIEEFVKIALVLRAHPRR